MATFQIQPLVPEDVVDFVECQFEAFVGNSLHDVVFPDQHSAVKSHQDAIDGRKHLEAGNDIVYLKAVDNQAGKLVGGIKCLFYGGQEVAYRSPYAASRPCLDAKAPHDEQYRRYVTDTFLARRVRHIKGQHALLDLLSVHPDFHRQGIGKQLVAQGCAMADERGLRFIVEASAIGKRTYELCGFQSKDTVTIEPGRWEGKPVQLCYWMEREPVVQVLE